MDRPLRIAMLARRYRTLSRRPDLHFARDDTERFEALLTLPMSMVDRMLVMESDEIDKVCGQVVTILSRKGGRRTELLELLLAIDADRVVAIFYALDLSAGQRQRLRSQEPEWSYAISKVEDEMGEALLDVEELAGLTGARIPRIPFFDPETGEPAILARMPQRFLDASSDFREAFERLRNEYAEAN